MNSSSTNYPEARLKENMDEKLKEFLVEELGRSFLTIPFEAWLHICKKTRERIRIRFPKKSFPEMTEEDARLWYTRYCFHVDDNCLSFLKSVVTGYPNFCWPNEVEDLIKYQCYKEELRFQTGPTRVKQELVEGKKRYHSGGVSSVHSDDFDKSDLYDPEDSASTASTSTEELLVMPKKKKIALDFTLCQNPEPPPVPMETAFNNKKKSGHSSSLVSPLGCRNMEINPSPPKDAQNNGNLFPSRQQQHYAANNPPVPSSRAVPSAMSPAFDFSTPPPNIQTPTKGAENPFSSRLDPPVSGGTRVNSILASPRPRSPDVGGHTPVSTRNLYDRRLPGIPSPSSSIISGASDNLSVSSSASSSFESLCIHAGGEIGWSKPYRFVLPSSEEVDERRKLSMRGYHRRADGFSLFKCIPDLDQTDPRTKVKSPIVSDPRLLRKGPGFRRSSGGRDRIYSDTPERSDSVDTDISSSSTIVSMDEKSRFIVSPEAIKTYRDREESYLDNPYPEVQIDSHNVLEEEESSSEGGDDIDPDNFSQLFERRKKDPVIEAPMITVSQSIFETKKRRGSISEGNSNLNSSAHRPPGPRSESSHEGTSQSNFPPRNSSPKGAGKAPVRIQPQPGQPHPLSFSNSSIPSQQTSNTEAKTPSPTQDHQQSISSRLHLDKKPFPKQRPVVHLPPPPASIASTVCLNPAPASVASTVYLNPAPASIASTVCLNPAPAQPIPTVQSIPKPQSTRFPMNNPGWRPGAPGPIHPNTTRPYFSTFHPPPFPPPEFNQRMNCPQIQGSTFRMFGGPPPPPPFPNEVQRIRRPL